MSETNVPVVEVLGIAQDGGVPHVGTRSVAWDDRSLVRLPVSLGIADPSSGERWMIEATPDFKEQLHRFDSLRSRHGGPAEIDGIAITHAHIGHYLGLASLGKEMLDSRSMPVLVMPRMRSFLENNLPWSDLVLRGNVVLRELADGVRHRLNERITLTPFLVPHRDEHSETVGFRISGPERSLLFIPDIDRWEEWDNMGHRIEEELAGVDLAFLDGTFFDDRELPGRNMATIPHPTVVSSMRRFASLPPGERRKIRFIHLNHSNPLLDSGSGELKRLRDAGFDIAEEGEIVTL